MGSDGAQVAGVLPKSSCIKVHNLMCTELMKFVRRISEIFPAIESAQPRCSLGIEALCALNLAMEKAKMLIQHCSESSKLYLVITGDAIMMRCERVRNAMEQSLSQIQTMVPILLAGQVSAIVDDLKDVKFHMESSEKKAGMDLLALLRQAADWTEVSEFNAFKSAALRLNITSSKALLIEKRSIMRLLDKVHGTDLTKERILKYILYLVKKYGKAIKGEQTVIASSQNEDLGLRTIHTCDVAAHDQAVDPEPNVEFGEVQADICNKPLPPEEFRCPISMRLMYDPVVIASGQTFERLWIEKWFNEGHHTCPKTQKKLPHLSMTPNSVMKDLISKWCRKHGITIENPCSQQISAALYPCKTSSSISIASFGSSLNDVPLRNYDVSATCSSNSSSDSTHITTLAGFNLGSPQTNDDSQKFQSFGKISHGMGADFLAKLDELPWESQCNLVEDVKSNFEDTGQQCHFILSSSSVKTLVRFLKDACDRCDVRAQRVGAQVLLMSVSKRRNEVPSLCEEAFHLLVTFLDSEITEEALAIMQVLSGDLGSQSEFVASGVLPSILRILDSQTREFQASAVRILNDLSSNSNINSQIICSGYIPKLISLLCDSLLAGPCIQILKNICKTEEGRIAIVEANGSIAAIVELLEIDNHEEQEHGVAILLSLCSHHVDYCQLVLKEGVIPSLVNISVNGNSRAKETALQLLRLLRDITYDDAQESSPPVTGSNPELPCDSGNCFVEKKPTSQTSRSLVKKFKIFSKQRFTLAPC